MEYKKSKLVLYLATVREKPIFKTTVAEVLSLVEHGAENFIL